MLLGALSLQYFENREIRERLRQRLSMDDVSQSRIQQDLLSLKKFAQGGAEEIEVYGALIRLARLRESAALSFALKQQTSSSLQVKLAAAEALGHFPESQATEALIRMLDMESEPALRFRLIQALGRLSLPERQEKLDKILNQTAGSESQEQFLVHQARILSSQDPRLRQTSLEWIQQRALDRNSPLYGEALKSLVSHRREDPFTMEVLRQAVTHQEDTQVAAMGIRFLATQKDPWIEQQLSSLTRSPSPQIRMAAVQSLHRSCPPDLGRVFRQIFFEESDPRVLDLAYRGLSFLPGPSTRSFIYQLLKETDLPSRAKGPLEDLLNNLSDNDRRNPCRDQPLVTGSSDPTQ